MLHDQALAATGLLAPTGDGSGEAVIQWENEQATLTVTTTGGGYPTGGEEYLREGA